MKKSTLIKVMSMFIIALCVFGTVTCNKTDDSTEEAKLMKSYPNSDGNFESDLCNYESDRLYIIREDSNPSGMRFMEDGSLQRFGNASIGTYSTVTDIFGVIVYENILLGNQGNKVMDLRDIASGIYTCTIRCNDCQMTSKLVIAQ